MVYRPPPESPWLLRFRLQDLLFTHWPVPVAVLERVLPGPLAIDTFEDRAWVSVVSLTVTDLRVRWLPSLPNVFNTMQVNVRTYVTMDGDRGVFFLSIDTANILAAWGARRFFHLPCFHSRISCSKGGDPVEFSSNRRGSPAELMVQYRPGNESFQAARGSLDEWLLERYRLYSADTRGRLWRGDIHHAPWSLRPVEAEVVNNTMTLGHGIAAPTSRPLFHFTPGLETLAGPLQRLKDDL